MPIKIYLPVDYYDRLLEKSLDGSAAKKALLSASPPTGDNRTIVCDQPSAEALRVLAAMCCVPAGFLIAEAILNSYEPD
jgi:hypothetical protein